MFSSWWQAKISPNRYSQQAQSTLHFPIWLWWSCLSLLPLELIIYSSLPTQTNLPLRRGKPGWRVSSVTGQPSSQIVSLSWEKEASSLSLPWLLTTLCCLIRNVKDCFSRMLPRFALEISWKSIISRTSCHLLSRHQYLCRRSTTQKYVTKKAYML